MTLHDQIGRQPVQVDLRGMLDPVALPVVVHLGVELLVLAVDGVGQHLLHPLALS